MNDADVGDRLSGERAGTHGAGDDRPADDPTVVIGGVSATGGERGSGIVLATGGEQGSGTVLAIAAIGVLLVVSVAGVQLGAAATAAHRARSAADLSALAGAVALQEGAVDPCAKASHLATANGARLVACGLETAESLRVRVTTDVHGSWPGVPRTASASARAGPTDTGLHGSPAPRAAEP